MIQEPLGAGRCRFIFSPLGKMNCSENPTRPWPRWWRTPNTVALAQASDATRGGAKGLSPSGCLALPGNLLIRGLLLQQVINDHKDRVRHRDSGSLLASIARDPAKGRSFARAATACGRHAQVSADGLQADCRCIEEERVGNEITPLPGI